MSSETVVGLYAASVMFIGLGKSSAVSGGTASVTLYGCCLHHIVLTKVSALEKPPDSRDASGL